MNPRQFSLRTAFFWLTTISILFAHGRLSYPAMTCRNYPPLTDGQLLATFYAPLLVWLPAIFGNRNARLLGVLVFAIGFAFVYGITEANLKSGRPSTGHLMGISGVLRCHSAEVVANWVSYSFVLVFVLFFYERVSGDLWRAAFRLPNHGNY